MNTIVSNGNKEDVAEKRDQFPNVKGPLNTRNVNDSILCSVCKQITVD